MFRCILSDQLSKILEEYQLPNDQSKGLPMEVINKFDLLKIDALLCLRLAMKHSENQTDFYLKKVDVQNDMSISISLHLFFEIE